ncbi:MAG: AAA family ATPase [Candidatus Lambdaproteobacteria bacterium]|nr:AAA family ATPase [Candidatus Lambdaproteobacteria bacterium]
MLQHTFQTIRGQMDAFVIGQAPVKEALMLGLIAHEHIYLQGEPGCAKTLLAEVAGNSAELTFQFAQLHRDTRVNELVGDIVLRRTLNGRGAEVISQGIRPGGLLTADVALLDDITRAPGEALSVLLRVLNERQYLHYRLPLMTAIATTNPIGSDYYNEPLDPANLDRFTLQMKTAGSVGQGCWDEARQIMDRYDGAAADVGEVTKVPAGTLRAAREELRTVVFPPRVRKAYQDFLDALINRYGCTPKNSLLTDRTMLIKVPRMIKALALLEGRHTTEPGDLRVLKYILTFRVPEHIYENLEEILKEFIDQPEQGEGEADESEQMSGMQGQEDDEADGEGMEDEQTSSGDEQMAEEIADALEAEGEDMEKRKPMQQQASGSQDTPRFQQNTPQHVENVDFVLEKIRGRLERNPAESDSHPGGSPRTFKRMNTFEEFVDTDPAESAIWLDSTHPTLPRSFRRQKKHMGGKVVIIRDVSQSMEGRYARWTSSVVTNLVDLVRRKRMRIGYIEFNHVSRKYDHDGRFFTRDYDKIIEKASNVSCSGVTNYQYPLRDALNELRGGRVKNKHILFLTDGEPTQGDWLVREERRQAKSMGVAIHTIFIGTTECPEILDILSEETEGTQFLATPDGQGGLSMGERIRRQPADSPGHGGGNGDAGRTRHRF